LRRQPAYLDLALLRIRIEADEPAAAIGRAVAELAAAARRGVACQGSATVL
jgi:hypothetical protein